MSAPPPDNPRLVAFGSLLRASLVAVPILWLLWRVNLVAFVVVATIYFLYAVISLLAVRTMRWR